MQTAELDRSPPKRQRKPRAARTNGKAVEPVEHPSRLRPIEFNVLVKRKKVEEVTKGGIFIPEVAQERLQAAAIEGEVIAVSPLAFTYERWPEGYPKPKAGDRVHFAKYAGMVVRGEDGEEYLYVKDKDLAGVIA